MQWTELPPLPDPIGFAGPFVGVSNDALIVAGGANFPAGRPWDGHPKVWHDPIFVLKDAGAFWQIAEDRLPRRAGYGASVSWRDRLICIGGGNAAENFRDVFSLRWKNGRIESEELPPLPRPMAMGGAALVHDTIYVAGGIEQPEAGEATKNFWAIDLSEPPEDRHWRELPHWPGPARILPVAGTQNGSFYLFSGAELVPGEDGKPTRRYLADAYCYRASRGWWRIADLPRPATAAPSPAFAFGEPPLAIIGGDDGAHFAQAPTLRDKHPGFAGDLLIYNTITNTWISQGGFPKGSSSDLETRPEESIWPPVTTGTTLWRDRFVAPSGEIRPGVRTPRVLWGTPTERRKGFYPADYAVLVAYFAVLLGIGFYFGRHNTKTESYFLGGHNIPWWAAGLSIYGGQLSAITFLALPAKSYSTNWSHMLGNLMIVVMVPIVIYFYLPFFRRLNVTSIYEYLERRFSLLVRLLGSATFLLLHLARLGIVLYLPSMALSAVTALHINWCIAAMGLLTTVYTTMGGVQAVIWTDVVQVLVLLTGAILSLAVMLHGVEGGLPALLSSGQAAGKLSVADLSWEPMATIVWVLLFGRLLEQFVPYTADQTVAQRYLTTCTERQAARSLWTNGILVIPTTLLFFFLGTALWGFYRAHPTELDLFGKGDEILPWFIAHQLPVGISGLVIAAVFAAAQSTLSTSINSMATVVTTDFYRRLTTDPSEQSCMRLARVATFSFGLVGTAFAYWMAYSTNTSIWDTNLRLVGLIGGPLAGLFAVGIFTRRPGALAATVGYVVGVVVLMTLEVRGLVSYLLFAGIGMFSCVGTAVLVGMIVPCKNRALDGLTILRQKQ